jgi:serine/threonine protein kinase
LDDLIFDDVGTMLLAGGVSNGTSSADADAVVAVETNITATHRLQWALDVARGIQALHEMPGGSIVHADLQAKQFLVSPTTGIVKVNDFNRCRFMATNTSYHHRASTAAAAELTTATTEPNASSLPLHSPHRYCSFRIPTAPGKMRSPEEYSFATLDEKIDIYATANILYSIFTKRDAWYESNERDAKFKIQDGVVPDMDIAWPDATLSTRTRLVQLTQRAYALDATQRISAKELVLELEALLDFHSRQHSVMRNSSADLVAPE